MDKDSMNTEQLCQTFRRRLARIHALNHALVILQYDSATVAPAASYGGYSETLGILSQEQYRLNCDEEMGQLLAALLEQKEALPLPLAREAEELERSRRRLQVIPQAEYGEYAALQGEAGSVWREAKRQDDYALFQPYLARLIEYSSRFARYFDAAKPVYDTMLDEYERDMNTATLDGFFDLLRQEITPLLAQINSAPPPPDSFLRQRFPEAAQRQLSARLMEILALDPRRCVLGETEHPFTTGVGNKDVRITTHYYEDDMLSSMYSIIHEGGHALYMLHVDDSLAGLSIDDGASMGLHESQSRLFENMIGRSQKFLTFLWPELVRLFPSQLAEADAQAFYRAVNRCQPSLIRINADELTYPLHIMVRYELEKSIFNGDATVAELPERWRQLYRDYLGVTPPDDRSGILQDMHWSDGSFGYFPTYALGSAYSAQFMAAISRETDIWPAVAAGDLGPLRQWLADKVWRFGGLKLPNQLLLDATGEPFRPAYYVDYLKGKFSRLYGL